MNRHGVIMRRFGDTLRCTAKRADGKRCQRRHGAMFKTCWQHGGALDVRTIRHGVSVGKYMLAVTTGVGPNDTLTPSDELMIERLP
jgi:hypothetical protein